MYPIHDCGRLARLARLLQLAQIKVRASLEDLDFRAWRGLDRAQIASLGSCDWMPGTKHAAATYRRGIAPLLPVPNSAVLGHAM